MNYNIRKNVLENLKNANADAVRSTIEDAMNIKEDNVLPGLGVMLELAWKKATPELRNNIINSIQEGVKH